MANSLYRQLEKGEIVILAKEYANPDNGDNPFKRAIVAETGLGMSPFTLGTAIGGYWLDDSRPDTRDVRIEGHMIDAAETRAYQDAHGRLHNRDS